MQLGVPPAGGQTLPQVLQLLTSELVFVSQPFVRFPSQSLNPALQTGTQTVPLQLVVPCALEHETPQAPQFVVVLVGVSQPFRVFASQSPKPPLQVGTQLPPVHTVEPFVFVQGWPQPPQCAAVD